VEIGVKGIRSSIMLLKPANNPPMRSHCILFPRTLCWHFDASSVGYDVLGLVAIIIAVMVLRRALIYITDIELNVSRNWHCAKTRSSYTAEN